MFKIKLDGDVWSAAISNMASFASEGYIHMHEPGVMFMRAMDIAGIGLIESKVKCVVEGTPTDFCVDFSTLPTISGEAVLEIDKQILVHAGRANYKISTLSPSAVRKVPDPKVPYTVIVDMPGVDLKFGLKTIADQYAAKDTSGALKITWTPDALVFEDREQSKVDVTYEKSELNIKMDPATKVTTMLPIDYVKLLVTPVSKFPRCVVGFGQDLPISIGSMGIEGYGCGWMIAPRVGD
jgi:hypothetical protein